MLLQLAIKALLVALLPLTVVWVSRDSDKLRKLAWVTVFLTFDLVMFGAFTRLTDSGLGCPDWPGCYGEANPFLAHAQIAAAEAAMPTGPVTVFKAWIEMIHRYLAMGVGVLIIAQLIITVRKWRETGKQDARYAPGFPALLLGFVCLQGAFGAWTVTLKLQPVIVTIHLLLGISLLCLLVWQAMRLGKTSPAVVQKLPAGLRTAAAVAVLILFSQIALGGWVSTNYAALACTEFPLCQGQVVPPMDFEHGFHLWRELGRTAGGEYLPFSALVAVHWTHRSFAFFVLLVVGFVAWQSRQLEGTRRLGSALLLLLAVQLCTGIATVFFNWPLAIAVLHNGGAALLAALLTMLNFRLSAAGTAGQPAWAASSPSPARS